MKKNKTSFSGFQAQSSKIAVLDSKFNARSAKTGFQKINFLSFKVNCLPGVCLILLTFSNLACVNKSLLANKSVVANVAENTASEFDRDLQTMKTADFDYIFAFRRKDGNVFDGDDKKFLRANTPPGTNRFISTDDGRAFIAGSRYVFSPENLAALQNRFAVEDYSKPPKPPTPDNLNANK